MLEMGDYDVILGMNWLSKYHACVDYYHKTVTIQFEDETSDMFQVEMMSIVLSFVSCTKVQKC